MKKHNQHKSSLPFNPRFSLAPGRNKLSNWWDTCLNEIVRTVRIEDKSKFVMKGDPRPRSIFETAEGELRFNLCGKEGNQGDYQYAGMVLLLFDLTEYPDLGRVEKVVEKAPHTLLAYSRDDRESIGDSSHMAYLQSFG